MTNIAVVTDSTSDITPDVATQWGVTVVPLYINFRDKVLKDRIEIGTSDVFKGVAEGAAMPSTSQPTPVDFERAFEAALQKAEHVLSLNLSHKLSGTFQSATLAAQNFPGRVTVIDTMVASGSLAMMVERATRMFREGASLDTVKATIERAQKVASLYFSVASLDYLRKNGRIGGAQALIGGLLNIKPILHLQDGRIEAAGRARGAQKALAEMLELAKRHLAKNGASRAVYIYTEKIEDVAPLRDACAKLGIEEFAALQTGPVIAAHVGPGTYGVLLEPKEI